MPVADPLALILGQGLTALAFLALALGALVTGRGTLVPRRAAAGAAVVTALTAAAIGLGPLAGLPPLPLEVADALRLVGWLGVLAVLAGGRHRPQAVRTPAIMAALAVAALVVGAGLGIAVAIPAALLMLAIAGLALAEQVLRAATEDGRWAIKHLCFGIGLLLAYDVYYYAEGLLFGRLSATVLAARGYVFLLAVPLIAVSLRRQGPRRPGLRVSRQAAVQGITLMGAGIYLTAMAAVATGLRTFGGTWGPVAQIAFLAGSLVLLAAVLGSGAFRAGLRGWLSRHVFHAHYDYRAEWLRFTRTIAQPEDTAEGVMPLHERVLRAVAAIVESPAGALWQLRPEDNAFLPSADWNMGADRLTGVSADAPWLRLLEGGRAVPVAEVEDAPDWLRHHPRAWVLLPLPHRDGLQGLLLLAHPRAGGRLTAEDRELLEVVAWQAAGYLAEERAQEALSDARRLEAFNRRFAFVIHDVKNVVSQMSLMVRNAERFGDDPDFQQDMLETVRNSVERMQTLLVQIKADRARAAHGAPPAQTVGEVITAAADRWPGIEVAIASGRDVPVPGADRLSAVLDHLLGNAIDAAGPEGAVQLSARRAGAEDGHGVVVDVADDGPGMDPDFVRDRLFRPLETAKDDGWGIGAWQCRETVRGLGGRLEVETAPGQGTRMRIHLPLTPSAADRPSAATPPTAEAEGVEIG